MPRPFSLQIAPDTRHVRHILMDTQHQSDSDTTTVPVTHRAGRLYLRATDEADLFAPPLRNFSGNNLYRSAHFVDTAQNTTCLLFQFHTNIIAELAYRPFLR